jgi:hypothetical protein
MVFFILYNNPRDGSDMTRGLMVQDEVAGKLRGSPLLLQSDLPSEYILDNAIGIPYLVIDNRVSSKTRVNKVLCTLLYIFVTANYITYIIIYI